MDAACKLGHVLYLYKLITKKENSMFLSFLCFYGLNQLRMHSTFVSEISVVVVAMFEVLDDLLFLHELFDYV